MVDKLKDILSTQLKLMSELLTLLERETAELLAVNLDSMAEINALKESTTERINKHTDPLRQAVSGVATNSNLASNASLVEVITYLGKRGHKDIPRMYQNLNTVAKQVRRAATLNQDIAERSLSMVGIVLFILAQLLEQSLTYGSSGSYQQWPAGGIIISNDV